MSTPSPSQVLTKPPKPRLCQHALEHALEYARATTEAQSYDRGLGFTEPKYQGRASLSNENETS